MLSFIQHHIYIILFYLILGVIILIFRKHFDVESGFILLWRTKLGINLMNKLSKKSRALVKLFGYSGIGFGFAGMLFVLYSLIKSAFTIFTKNNSTQSLSLVLPGTNIPGIGVLSFSYWIITLFVIAVVHEFSHGVVARAHKIRVKNSGLVLFGPIIGAFVEPSEKQLTKADPVVQYSVFSAGPFSNILLAGLAILLMNLLFIPAFSSVSQSSGVYFSSIEKNMPAYNASIKPNVVYTYVNNVSINNSDKFLQFMMRTRPNETLVFKDINNKTYTLKTVENPDNKALGFIGVVGINTKLTPKPDRKESFKILNWIINLLKFLGVLSLGIGLFNLLPLGIVDGGRMLKAFLDDSFKDKKKSTKIWAVVSTLTLALILFDLIMPLLVKLL